MSDDRVRSVRRILRAHAPRRVLVLPPLKEAAVSLILAPGPDARTSLLFIKRAAHPDDPWSGQIALPGGRRDASDPDLLTTATRETAEETGVVLGPDDLVGELDDLSPVSPHLPPLVVRPFVFALPAPPPIRLSDEAVLHLWIACDDLRGARHEEDVRARDRTLHVPGYRIGPHFVWGMTERIVTPFLQYLLLV
jgi:8-oxo-dGTP pyrophosphatase MutT (NUDIX family)